MNLPLISEAPDSHAEVRATRDQQLYLGQVNHVQDSSIMANDRLKRTASFQILRFPQLDCAICATRDEHVEFVNASVDEATDIALMGLGTLELNDLVLLASVNEGPRIHVSFLVVKNLARGKANEHVLVGLRRVAVAAETNLKSKIKALTSSVFLLLLVDLGMLTSRWASSRIRMNSIFNN